MPVSRKVAIRGNINGKRVSSRVLEEEIQRAVKEGAGDILVLADGQQGIGGRIWPGPQGVRITVEGPSGQRLGSMGMPGTEITLKGSASDDVGWINCGAKITVLGDVTNGAHNAAAQGVLYVRGGGGARCDTMTKHNPRFDPPESWYFRDVGDCFAEFKAGGIAVVCGVNPRNPENILGYHPCVGMVGGTIYFRGPIREYSDRDVKLLELTPSDWKWLIGGMKRFLQAIGRMSHYGELADSPSGWRKLVSYSPDERRKRKRFPVTAPEFRRDVWEKEVGAGGIFAEFLGREQTAIPYIATGEDRRNKPVWANEKYLPPCAYACPTHIPTHKRTALIRQGKPKEALELVLEYSPLPATVCGEICPNLCMQSCTRGRLDKPVNAKEMGRLALGLAVPKVPKKKTGYRIAVIGGGPAGLSASWQLALRGHEVSLYEAAAKLGGKLELCIPRERLPQRVLLKELSRFEEIGVKTFLGKKITRTEFGKIYLGHDAVVVACGAHKPRRLEFAGSEHAVPAIEFLKEINTEGPNKSLKGKKVVVVGAGNAGMDVAVGAFNRGAASVAAVDIQRPAAFGKELELAEARGTKVLWPKTVKFYDKRKRKIHFTDETSLEADFVVVAVGEVPMVGFLPPEIHTEKNWIAVNSSGQTSDAKVYAIGDATRPGLVTHAIGQGRTVAEAIHSELMHYVREPEAKDVIPYEKIKTDYYEACRTGEFKPDAEASACMSCATCRDCRMCEAICYPGAISRRETGDGSFEYAVDDDKCIGCGFCAGVCPCGVWEMVENL